VTVPSTAPTASDEPLRAAELAARYGLHRIGARPPLLSYIRQIWERRHFIWALASARSYNRKQNNYLGQLWTVLNPLILAAVYYLVFGVILGTGEGTDNYVGFLVIGIFSFQYFAGTVSAGASSISGNMAMIRALAWIDAQVPGQFSEIDVVRALEGFRRDAGAIDISFDTICGAGPNGAIVHYRVTEATNRTIRAGDLLLLDSGGQYGDGTTDITRTIATGPASEVARDAYTRVLQGMIGLSRLRFPRGMAGRDIEAVARAPLWTAGMDFDHGTGHGVGAALCVHEGPLRISRRSELPLEPGMIFSNEPGYYREGEWGIRIENLIAVEPAASPDGRDMLGFETLTLVPIDRRLIEPGMLSRAETAWLDAYHARVRAKILPLLPEGLRGWLEQATAPL